MKIDPIRLEVIASRLDEIQQVMKHRLFHTGYSVILRESFDGSAGLVTAQGQVLGSAGSPTRAEPYARIVRAILEKYAGNIHPGDCYITNDPYVGGVPHTPDVAVCTPVFWDGELVMFCTSMGHKPDIGGIAPSTASAASRSIFHEGLLVPPVKLHEKGQLNEGIRSILQNNSRTPYLLIGDIEGQVGCTRVGAELVEALYRKFGADTVRQATEWLVDGARTRLLKGLAAMPDGETESENWLDSDGVTQRPVRIHVKLTKRGEVLRLDFSGCDPQTAGPANAVVQVTRAAAVGAVISFVDHTIPFNQGALDAVDIHSPAGTVIHPVPPAPVNSYMPAVHLVFNVVTDALGKLMPERAVGESGLGVGAIAFSYPTQPGAESCVQYDIVSTALGGTPAGDGAAMIFPMTNMETVQPIEVIEIEYPVRVRQFGIRTDSGGAGLHRGGIGYVKEFEVLQPSQFMSRLSQRQFGARGSTGGLAPLPSVSLYNPGRPGGRSLQGLDQVAMDAGDTVRIEQSGGGGMGDPRARDPELVLMDFLDGYVSQAAAERDYGCVIRKESSGKYSVSRKNSV